MTHEGIQPYEKTDTMLPLRATDLGAIAITPEVLEHRAEFAAEAAAAEEWLITNC